MPLLMEDTNINPAEAVDPTMPVPREEGPAAVGNAPIPEETPAESEGEDEPTPEAVDRGQVPDESAEPAE